MLKKKITVMMLIAAIAGASASAALADDTASTTPPAPPEGVTEGMTPPDGEGKTPPNGDMTPPDGEGMTPPNGEGMTPPDGEMKMPFADIASDAWYYESVSKAYAGGLISGMSDTEFSPESSVTGAQLITMLYRTDGNKTSSEYSGNWYDEAVEWARANSIITDNDGWTFEPEAELTREQMMVLIYNYMEYKGIDCTEAAELSSYSDYSQISSSALNAVKCLVAKGIVEGDGVSINPKDSLTRAQTAAILVRAVNKINPQALQGSNGAPEKPGGQQGGPGGFGGSGTVTQGTAATTISEDGTYSNTSYSSTGDDENALRVDGAEVTLNSVAIDKSAGATSNTEDGDFYGMNAAFLATNGANVTIKNAKVTSSAQNGNGVFSYGTGTTVNISDSEITTTADNSGGIQTTGGATTNASNLTVNTSGNSSAAIRSDRGGGTVNVKGGTYTSNGYNSPAVYSTAEIAVSDAVLTANNSEALVIEGHNSIALEDCEVSGNMDEENSSSGSENVHNVMLYQSMSGDAQVGTSTLSINGGSLTGNNGDLFYITNTHAIVTLSGVTVKNNDSDAYLMKISGNSAKRGWGSAGSNGAQAEVTFSGQTIEGDIAVDTISTLDLTLSDNSSFTGTVNIIDNAEGGTAVSDNADITIEAGSTWTLSGNCTVTSVVNNGTINYNGYTITLADGTVMSE